MRRVFHPLTTVILLTLLWGVLVVLWIIWFLGKRQEYRDLVAKYQPELLQGSANWFVLVQGLVLLALILAGIYAIFLFWKRQADLFDQQSQALAQITHELKSPLASIQLHIETIRLRRPDQDKLDRFLDTMLLDTERLHNLINNLLLAARLEQRRKEISRPTVDFSATLTSYLERFREKLPEGGSLTMQIEQGIKLPLDLEGMETALRNLLENAVLYSPATPELSVSLTSNERFCHLRISDKGMGIDPKQLKMIFKMFYRVRSPGENIKGSGLGLHIVQSVVAEHNGKVWVESAGSGAGSCFIIELPISLDSLEKNA